jgi:hypothetical protein
VQPGDHLVTVQGVPVTGKDLDSVLSAVQGAPAEGVAMKFYRGSLGDVINPRVFFDISIGGSGAGRIVCRLRKDVVPKTVEVREHCVGAAAEVLSPPLSGVKLGLLTVGACRRRIARAYTRMHITSLRTHTFSHNPRN